MRGSDVLFYGCQSGLGGSAHPRGGGEMADTGDLKSSDGKPSCGFESRPPYHVTPECISDCATAAYALLTPQWRSFCPYYPNDYPNQQKSTL